MVAVLVLIDRQGASCRLREFEVDGGVFLLEKVVVDQSVRLWLGVDEVDNWDGGAPKYRFRSRTLEALSEAHRFSIFISDIVCTWKEPGFNSRLWPEDRIATSWFSHICVRRPRPASATPASMSFVNDPTIADYARDAINHAS
jgi:hypothetical protein